MNHGTCNEPILVFVNSRQTNADRLYSDQWTRRALNGNHTHGIIYVTHGGHALNVFGERAN